MAPNGAVEDSPFCHACWSGEYPVIHSTSADPSDASPGYLSLRWVDVDAEESAAPGARSSKYRRGTVYRTSCSTPVKSVADRKRLILALIAAGLTRIELTSFVSPRWIPQLSDADELVRTLQAPPGVALSALCPNTKGLERAIGARVGLEEVAVFLSASETHNVKNTNKPIERSLEVFDEQVPHAIKANMRVRGVHLHGVGVARTRAKSISCARSTSRGTSPASGVTKYL